MKWAPEGPGREGGQAESMERVQWPLGAAGGCFCPGVHCAQALGPDASISDEGN